LTILVGNNGAGKTTILEAVQLACAGQYRGESIRRALSQSLFNKDDVESLLNSSGLDIAKKLPSINIEVFLTGGERHIVELFSGANNSTGAKHCGFSLTIAFDNDFIEELAGILDNGRITSVPIEYYEAKWMTFAGSIITPRKLPVHSVMMNPTGEWLGNRSDERAARILIDGLTERQQMALAQDARTAFDSWNNTEKWLRTSGITAGIPVAAPLHHMDERLMHPEEPEEAMAKGHAGGLSRKECESRGTLLEFLERYPDEESCERRLLEEKHPGGFVCPACGNRTCSKVHGHAHKWQCTKCSRQFSVTAGTMMEGTHLELRKWFVAIWLMSSQKAGISACSLQRQIGCSYKTAGRVLARIRCAMARSECVQRAVG
jgi:transposase-like protein/energy-coupling factor transporter ATP-binding protein EcfA2